MAPISSSQVNRVRITRISCLTKAQEPPKLRHAPGGYIPPASPGGRVVLQSENQWNGGRNITGRSLLSIRESLENGRVIASRRSRAIFSHERNYPTCFIARKFGTSTICPVLAADRRLGALPPGADLGVYRTGEQHRLLSRLLASSRPWPTHASRRRNTRS